MALFGRRTLLANMNVGLAGKIRQPQEKSVEHTFAVALRSDRNERPKHAGHQYVSRALRHSPLQSGYVNVAGLARRQIAS